MPTYYIALEYKPPQFRLIRCVVLCDDCVPPRATILIRLAEAPLRAVSPPNFVPYAGVGASALPDDLTWARQEAAKNRLYRGGRVSAYVSFTAFTLAHHRFNGGQRSNHISMRWLHVAGSTCLTSATLQPICASVDLALAVS